MRLHIILGLRTGLRQPKARAVAALFLALVAPCAAQRRRVNPLAPKTPPTQVKQPLPQWAREMTADDVAAFLDGIIPQQLGREDIAGAVVVVVKDGKVLFSGSSGILVA